MHIIIIHYKLWKLNIVKYTSITPIVLYLHTFFLFGGH